MLGVCARPLSAGVPEDYMEIEAGDTVEIRRLLIESISVEHVAAGAPSDDSADEI